MKKISDFIPNKVIKKKELINRLDMILNNSLDSSLKQQARVISFSDDCITIECDNSSVGSIIKFEKDKYISLFKDKEFYNIIDLKVKIR
tara:strand:+ start:102 stop:368 length:267 start_codon:yes stop_codon:yes gene_type:complete